MNNLMYRILEGRKTVRELIKEDAGEYTNNAHEYRHLFVRRWRENAESPYKRSKVLTAGEAVDLFIQWSEKYKNEKIEIWTDVGSDAKEFYRFCLKNIDSLGQQWKGTRRLIKDHKWLAVYKDIQTRARQSGMNLVGTLYPFETQIQ